MANKYLSFYFPTKLIGQLCKYKFFLFNQKKIEGTFRLIKGGWFTNYVCRMLVFNILNELGMMERVATVMKHL